MPFRSIGRAAAASLGLLLALGPTAALAADPNRCQALRQEHDALAAQAMAAEIALARQVRAQICPALQRQVEQANGTGEALEPLAISAWIHCRQRAEAALERHNPILYRNPQGFPYYSSSGAALAAQAEQRRATLALEPCQQP